MGRRMFYRVRKINGHYYLIKEYYDPKTGKKRTISLGNCEKIEALVRGVGFEPTQAYATGSSTRSPLTKPMRKRRVFPRFIAIHGRNEAEKFMKQCIQDASYETCIQYLSYLTKPIDAGNKWSILAYKKWAKYNHRDDLYNALKTRQSKPDLRVPSIDEVRESVIRACGTSHKLCMVYRILLESGARLREAVMVLNSFNEANLREHGGFYTYQLLYIRKTKKAFYIFTITRPERLDVSDKWVRNWAGKRRDVVSPKYIRKFVATTMSQLGIPLEVIDFIQGRSPQSVATRHYLNLYGLALQYYTKYREWLVKVFQFLYTNQ